jgi:hypothetical protein
MKKRTPEGQLTFAVRQLLNAAGIFHYKAWQGMGSAPGVSDIIGCLKGGRFFALELKAPKGVTSEYQNRFLENVRQAGGIGFVARTLDEVIEGLGLQDRFLRLK